MGECTACDSGAVRPSNDGWRFVGFCELTRPSSACVDDAGKVRARQELKSLMPGGQTNLWDGLHTGLESLRASYSGGILPGTSCLDPIRPHHMAGLTAPTHPVAACRSAGISAAAHRWAAQHCPAARSFADAQALPRHAQGVVCHHQHIRLRVQPQLPVAEGAGR